MRATLELERSLEDRDLAHHIGLHIELGPLERVAYARLGGEMHHMGRVGMGREEAAHQVKIGDVALDEGEGPDPRDVGEPVTLEGDRVIIIEVVDADDVVPLAQQALRQMRADEAGDAGDDDLHDAPAPARPSASDSEAKGGAAQALAAAAIPVQGAMASDVVESSTISYCF